MDIMNKILLPILIYIGSYSAIFWASWVYGDVIKNLLHTKFSQCFHGLTIACTISAFVITYYFLR